jgi:hypothetical protein
MATDSPAEIVHVENEWYDGPRAGVADIGGVPHRFKSLFDEKDDEYLGTFVVWAIDEATLSLEREQWLIFVAWNAQYEAGKASTDSHPGHGGLNPRWDELELLLNDSRKMVPASARRATAEVQNIAGADRYSAAGPAYKMGWSFL